MTKTVIDFSLPFDGVAPIEPWLRSRDGGTAPVLAASQDRHDAALGYGAGRLRLGAYAAELAPLAAHVFLVLRQGEIHFRETDGRETLLRAGDTAVLPRGLAGHWRNSAETSLVFVTLAGQEAAGPVALLRPDPRAELAPSAGPSAALLASEPPVCGTHMVFEDSTEQLDIGIWGATPYSRILNTFRHDELMFLLEGGVTITDAEGKAHAFGAGDCFMTTRGAGWAWHSAVPVKKVFCSFLPS